MIPLALAPLVGVRTGPLVPADTVGYGQVFVTTPGEPWVTQGTVRAGFEAEHLGGELGGTWVATAGHGLEDVALGRVRGTLGAWVGRGRPVFLGLEAATSVFEDVDRTALAWGTRARDVVPGVDLLLVGSYAHPSGHFGGRLAFGSSPGWYYAVVAADLTLVLQSGALGRWTAVGEVDLCTDQTVATLRPVARYAAPGGLQVDLGLQLPWPALAHTVTLQPLVQARWIGGDRDEPRRPPSGP